MTAEPLTMDEARARMLANVRAAGGRTVEDEAPRQDGLRPSPAAAIDDLDRIGDDEGDETPAEPAPTVAPSRDLDLGAIDDDGEAGTVTLVIDGQRHVLSVPKVSPFILDVAAGHGIKQTEIHKLMARSKSPEEMERLARQLERAQARLYQAIIPEMTPALYARLSAHQAVQLSNYCARLLRGDEMAGDANPNA